ncbi:MAG: hypothetical protein GF414_08555 [Candidatus Altiarchaeales archaeon]|nr:hypothetical protein [Candidatus Altiarchaeales archaeon]
MKKGIAIGMLAMLMVGMTMMPAPAAANGKVNTPEWGKEYSVDLEDGVSEEVCYQFPVDRGDKIFINTTDVESGGPLDVYRVYIGSTIERCSSGMKNNFLFVNSSNDNAMYDRLESRTNTSFWMTSAVDQPMLIYMNSVARVGESLSFNYTIEKLNATTPASNTDVESLQDEIARLRNETANLTRNQTYMWENITDLQSGLASLQSELADVNDSIPEELPNITGLQEEIDEISVMYQHLFENITRIDGRIDSLDIPEDANLTGVHENISRLSALYTYLSENLTRLEGSITEKTTYVYNNETIYAYDNETLTELEDDLQSQIESINQTTYVNNTTLENTTTVKRIGQDGIGQGTFVIGAMAALALVLGAGANARQSMSAPEDGEESMETLDSSSDPEDPDTDEAVDGELDDILDSLK